MKKQSTYLDYAAATPVYNQVRNAMTKIHNIYGNTSSIHNQGKLAKQVLEDARMRIASIINSRSQEIIFTSSGTEANNLAIFGIARAYSKKGKHIVTTNIEHHSVLRPLEYLEDQRYEITYVPVEQNGIVNPRKVLDAIREDTILISIMHANNEIGTIQPIKEIVKSIKILHLAEGEARQGQYTPYNLQPIFHIDACASIPYLDIDVHNLGIDLMSIAGAKFGGPKGIGALFVRHNVEIEPIILGGDQERGLRAGTVSAELALGMAVALEITTKNQDKYNIKIRGKRDKLLKILQKSFPKMIINGDRTKRLPNNINISFPKIDGERLMIELAQQGIDVSTGSACTVDETGPSHVIKALGQNTSSIRLTLG